MARIIPLNPSLPSLIRHLKSTRRPFLPRTSLSSIRSLATVSDFDPSTVERATDEVDVCIVGGGPAGLSAAIRLKQLEAEKGREIRVVVLEKGAEVGELVFPSPYDIFQSSLPVFFF